MHPRIIGLVGPSGSGKTTACNYLTAEYGFDRIHIASPVKKAFCELTGLPLEYTEAPLIDQPCIRIGGATPRKVLEYVGTAAHNAAPLLLPLVGGRRIDGMVHAGQNRILVDGIRRPAEGELVRRDFGGAVIRMVGTDVDPDKPCDISQQEVVHDFTLAFGPTEELHRQIDAIMASLGVDHVGADAHRAATAA